MTNYMLLNNITHRDLKIITKKSADYGDNIGYTYAFPAELRQLQAHYPICFRKNRVIDQMEMIALLGFHETENLFLNDEGWSANYIPLAIQREPFLIGFQSGDREGGQEPVVHINMDSPRISESAGEPVFLPQGGNTPYLEQINSILLEIFKGVEEGKAFVDMLIELDLLESFTLKAELDNGLKLQVAGFYTIHEEKLANLSGQAIATLHSKGYLHSIYMILASLSNVALMIEKKNLM